MGVGLGCLAAASVQAQGGNDYFDVSTSGFIRIESAFSTSSKRNPFNQIGNPFNGVAVDRLDLLGGSDTYVRQGPTKDEDINLSVLRGKFDVNVSLSRNWSFRGELRALFDVDLYKNVGLDTTPGADPMGSLNRKPNLFEYRVNGSSLMSRKNPGALEVSGRKFMMDLPRFYLDYHKGPLHVRMGNQQIAWGQSLFFRVMDIPNGLDLRRHSLLDYVPEEFSDKRVPALAVRVQYMAGSWELDGFVQHFRPTIYGNPDTPYNVIPVQFTVHDLYKDYDDKFNFGVRARGDIGRVKFQAMAARRYNPDGTFRWTQSGVHKPLGPGFEGTEGLMAQTAYEQDTSGVHSAKEWFTFAGLVRLDGIDGLNASIAEFPAAQALGAVVAPDYAFASQELDPVLPPVRRPAWAHRPGVPSRKPVRRWFRLRVQRRSGVIVRPAHRQRRSSVCKRPAFHQPLAEPTSRGEGRSHRFRGAGEVPALHPRLPGHLFRAAMDAPDGKRHIRQASQRHGRRR